MWHLAGPHTTARAAGGGLNERGDACAMTHVESSVGEIYSGVQVLRSPPPPPAVSHA